MEYLGIGNDGKLKLMDYYNRKCYPQVAANRKYKIQPNDDWCAMFTTVIANMVGRGSERFPYEVSVWQQAEWAKKRGLWFTDVTKAKPNDLIVYDWGKTNRYNHVGFVVHVGRLSLQAIEGNKDRTVAYRTVNVTSSQIKGFIRTNYTAPPVVDECKRIAFLVVETMQGEHGNGQDRKDSLGIDYYAVMEIINKK